MDSKRRGQTLTLSKPNMMKKKRKKEATRSGVLRKKRATEGLVSADASVVDHLSKLDAFFRYDCDGLSVLLDCGRGDRLSSPVKQYMQNLLKVNMEGPFGAEWPTEEKAKRQEMVAPEARYIFLWDDSGESMNKKWPDVESYECSGIDSSESKSCSHEFLYKKTEIRSINYLTF